MSSLVNKNLKDNLLINFPKLDAIISRNTPLGVNLKLAYQEFLKLSNYARFSELAAWEESFINAEKMDSSPKE